MSNSVGSTHGGSRACLSARDVAADRSLCVGADLVPRGRVKGRTVNCDACIDGQARDMCDVSREGFGA